MEHNKRIALFTGSFNPFTIGHAQIVKRALPLFDEIIIALGVNINKPDEKAVIEERVMTISGYFKDEKRIKVESYASLTIDFARQRGAKFILKGVRTITDYEYERQMADINLKLGGIDTVLLFAEPQYASISSSMVRELQRFGRDVSEFLPKPTTNNTIE